MRRYKHVLLATDFSDTSKVAAQQAADLAKYYGARLTCLHVVEHFPQHLPHYKIAHEGMDAEHFLLDRAGADLKDLCENLGQDDAEQHLRLTAHSAKAEIVSFAKEHGVDLLVLGARGRRNLLDVISGSTATGVVRAAPCDVFVVQGN